MTRLWWTAPFPRSGDAPPKHEPAWVQYSTVLTAMARPLRTVQYNNTARLLSNEDVLFAGDGRWLPVFPLGDELMHLRALSSRGVCKRLAGAGGRPWARSMLRTSVTRMRNRQGKRDQASLPECTNILFVLLLYCTKSVTLHTSACSAIFLSGSGSAKTVHNLTGSGPSCAVALAKGARGPCSSGKSMITPPARQDNHKRSAGRTRQPRKR